MLKLSLAVSGCALFNATRTTEPVVVDTSLRSFRPFTTRTGDTCETMREAAAHNSVYDSKKLKTRKVYCAPCDCPDLYPEYQQAPKPAAEEKPHPKVS